MGASHTFEVIIVGGGIVGTSCAYYLARRRTRVLLLEAGRVGRQASGVNAGGVRQQGRGLPELPLAVESTKLWAGLAEELGADLEYDRCGDLRLAETADDLSRLEGLVAAERAAGLHLEVLRGEELRRAVPRLSPHILAGSLCPTGGQANPLFVTATFGRRARALGATLLEGTRVRGIRPDGEGFACDSSRGLFRADQILVAAGPWSSELMRPLGVEVPIHLIPLQMMITEPVPRLLGPVLLGLSRKLSFKQVRAGGLLIGGGKHGHGDLSHREAWPSLSAIAGGARDATAVLPCIRRVEAVRNWVGLEAATPDLLPIIDRTGPGNLFLAAGFSGHGFAIGPVVGGLLAEWMLDGRPSMSLEAFRLSRFAGGRPAV